MFLPIMTVLCQKQTYNYMYNVCNNPHVGVSGFMQHPFLMYIHVHIKLMTIFAVQQTMKKYCVLPCNNRPCVKYHWVLKINTRAMIMKQG